LTKGSKVFLRRLSTLLIRFKRKLQGAAQRLIANLLQGLAVSGLPLKLRLPRRLKLNRGLSRANAAGTSRALRRLSAKNIHAPLRCWREFAALGLCSKLLAASKSFTRTRRKLLLQLPRLFPGAPRSQNTAQARARLNSLARSNAKRL
jgi:hypothetical protein